MTDISIIEERLKNHSLLPDVPRRENVSYGFKSSQEFFYEWERPGDEMPLRMQIFESRDSRPSIAIEDRTGFPTLSICTLSHSELLKMIDLLINEGILVRRKYV